MSWACLSSCLATASCVSRTSPAAPCWSSPRWRRCGARLSPVGAHSPAPAPHARAQRRCVGELYWVQTCVQPFLVTLLALFICPCRVRDVQALQRRLSQTAVHAPPARLTRTSCAQAVARGRAAPNARRQCRGLAALAARRCGGQRRGRAGLRLVRACFGQHPGAFDCGHCFGLIGCQTACALVPQPCAHTC